MRIIFSSLIFALTFVIWSSAQTFRVIHSFGGSQDGANPIAQFIEDSDGNLYSTTAEGGKAGSDTVFRITPSGNEEVLYEFGWSPDGVGPYAGLVRDRAGNLYGTTVSGGVHRYGTVFKIDASGKETLLHSFSGGSDGYSPQSNLTLDPFGNLYGTTPSGGLCKIAQTGCGTIYRVDSAGKHTLLYRFTGEEDGGLPGANLILDSEGNLYGTALEGGIFGYGVVFKLTPQRKLDVLYAFAGSDGETPMSLIRETDGTFYGTTGNGGACGQGTLFELTKAGTESVLHSFCGGDGKAPTDGLVRDIGGNFYGMTLYGGPYNFGLVFKVDSSGNETVLHTFRGSSDGGLPFAGLLQTKSGTLYGTSDAGGTGNGTSGLGTAFEVVP
jgi:uncharacterized repeat protein (TIGR03803 family)